MIENIVTTTPILVAIIIGTVEVAKKAGLSSRYAGVVSLVLGLFLGGISAFIGTPLVQALISGAVMGLVASGLYDLPTNLLGIRKMDN